MKKRLTSWLLLFSLVASPLVSLLNTVKADENENGITVSFLNKEEATITNDNRNIDIGLDINYLNENFIGKDIEFHIEAKTPKGLDISFRTDLKKGNITKILDETGEYIKHKEIIKIDSNEKLNGTHKNLPLLYVYEGSMFSKLEGESIWHSYYPSFDGIKDSIVTGKLFIDGELKSEVSKTIKYEVKGYENPYISFSDGTLGKEDGKYILGYFKDNNIHTKGSINLELIGQSKNNKVKGIENYPFYKIKIDKSLFKITSSNGKIVEDEEGFLFIGNTYNKLNLTFIGNNKNIPEEISFEIKKVFRNIDDTYKEDPEITEYKIVKIPIKFKEAEQSEGEGLKIRTWLFAHYDMNVNRNEQDFWYTEETPSNNTLIAPISNINNLHSWVKLTVDREGEFPDLKYYPPYQLDDNETWGYYDSIYIYDLLTDKIVSPKSFDVEVHLKSGEIVKNPQPQSETLLASDIEFLRIIPLNDDLKLDSDKGKIIKIKWTQRGGVKANQIWGGNDSIKYKDLIYIGGNQYKIKEPKTELDTNNVYTFKIRKDDKEFYSNNLSFVTSYNRISVSYSSSINKIDINNKDYWKISYMSNYGKTPIAEDIVFFVNHPDFIEVNSHKIDGKEKEIEILESEKQENGTITTKYKFKDKSITYEDLNKYKIGSVINDKIYSKLESDRTSYDFKNWAGVIVPRERLDKLQLGEHEDKLDIDKDGIIYEFSKIEDPDNRTIVDSKYNNFLITIPKENSIRVLYEEEGKSFSEKEYNKRIENLTKNITVRLIDTNRENMEVVSPIAKVGENLLNIKKDSIIDNENFEAFVSFDNFNEKNIENMNFQKLSETESIENITAIKWKIKTSKEKMDLSYEYVNITDDKDIKVRDFAYMRTFDGTFKKSNEISFGIKKETLEVPEINTIYDTDKRIIGRGIPGATVTLTFEGGRKVNTTVDVEGNFEVTIPEEVTLVVKERVTGKQEKEGFRDSADTFTEILGKSKTPVIDSIKEGDREITGSGVAGSKVKITLPNNEEIEVNVEENGKWRVEVPEGITLKIEDNILGKQKETDKEESAEVSKKVERNDRVYFKDEEDREIKESINKKDFKEVPIIKGYYLTTIEEYAEGETIYRYDKQRFIPKNINTKEIIGDTFNNITEELVAPEIEGYFYTNRHSNIENTAEVELFYGEIVTEYKDKDGKEIKTGDKGEVKEAPTITGYEKPIKSIEETENYRKIIYTYSKNKENLTIEDDSDKTETPKEDTDKVETREEINTNVEETSKENKKDDTIIDNKKYKEEVVIVVDKETPKEEDTKKEKTTKKKMPNTGIGSSSLLLLMSSGIGLVSFRKKKD